MLSLEQKQQLRTQGFLVLPHAVSPELVDRAVHTINARIGEGISPELISQFAVQSWFPELKSSPAITDLYNASQVGPTMAHLLGGHCREAGAGQLALRFPRPVGTEPRAPGPHLDGVHTPTNGVPKGTLGSFTALVGVFLTPVRRPFAGNFAVWPGSHEKMQNYFREHGVDELLQGGMTPRLDYGEGVQIEAEAGDTIIAHYQLMHGVTMNTSPNPRYAIFFRVTHPLHRENRLECLTDLWLEWPGVREEAPS